MDVSAYEADSGLPLSGHLLQALQEHRALAQMRVGVPSGLLCHLEALRAQTCRCRFICHAVLLRDCLQAGCRSNQ